MQLFGEFSIISFVNILSFVRVSRLNWIGYVNRMGSTRKVRQACKNNAQGNRIRGRPKNRWRKCELTDINRCRIKDWKGMSKNRADWEKSIKEAKVLIGL
jgi:hypothetical protein